MATLTGGPSPVAWTTAAPRWWAWRYGLAFVAVAAGFGLRAALTAWAGPGLPTYITFYPAVMVTALLAGFGPGLLATVLTAVAVTCWILPPEGFAITSPVERLGVVLFTGMGLFMSAVAEFYRRDRRKAATYDQEMAWREARREKEFLADVLEHASHPFAVGYPDGRMGLSNRAFEQLTGYSAEELRAIDWATTLTPPEWHERERQKLAELHRSCQPVRYEKEYVRKDGTRVPIELLVHLVRDTEGKPEYYYSFVTDITERKRTQAALRESEERLNFALETIHTGAWDLDLVDHTAFRSLEHDRIFGYAELLPEWTYERFLEHVLPEDRAAVDGKFRRAIEQQSDWNFECRIRRTDGQVRWILAAGRPRRDTTGAARRMSGIVQDITERKRAEEETRQLHQAVARERDRLSALLNSISDEIWFADTEGRFTLVNPSASNKFVLGAGDGVDVRRLVRGLEVRRPDGSSRPIEEAPPLRALRGEEVRNQEEMVRTPATGELRYRQVNASPVKNAAGAIIGSVSVVRDITELKRAEEALQASEERLRLAQESANVGVWDWQVGTGALDFTPELNKLYGLPAGTITTYQDWRERVHPEDIGRIEAARDEAIAKHEPFDLDFRGRHSSGEYRWISTKGGALYDDAGKAVRVFGVNIDVTQRKRAEEALGESEARFRTMANAMPQLAWIARPDGHISWYNQRWYEYTGTTPEQMEGWGWQSVHDPAELPAVLERWKACIATGHPFDMTFPLRGADGVFRLFLTRGYPLKDAAGRVVQWFGTNTDVSELKQAEEALRESEERLRRLNTDLEERVAERTAELRAAYQYARGLLEASLDPLVTISAEGKITDVNAASAQATGVPRAQLIGADFSDYFTEPDRAREGYRRVFAKGFVRDFPLAIRHASGRVTDVLYNATVYRNEAGAVQGVFAAARDITERKRVEAKLARYREHLEDLVRLRTAELARSNQELEQFAYVASHDLQEPLRAVVGYLRLIESRLEDKLDDKSRRHLEGAVEGAARMHSLITDLLALSRVETQGQPFEPTDLNTVLDRALQGVDASVREAGARITRDPMPTLRVEASQMAQLFQNLIGNAIKFRDERPPEIHIGAQQQADGQWRFAVRDNGIGIEPQYYQRIFMIFQRLHTRKEYPGTGMGLAICKKIVERHRGTIWVESQPGQGSTFYFAIPN